jgi:hypothetical protein
MHIMLQLQLRHLNGRKLGHRPVKPLKISMSGFALSYTANMFILVILFDFCLLPAQLYYIIVYIREVESRVQIVDRCAPWKISNVRRTLLRMRCNFKRYVFASNIQAG